MKVRRLFFSFAFCILFLGCNQSSGPFSVPIGEINANPRNYEGKVITISGTVTDTISLFVIKAFVLSDNSGQIHVITERILPKKGEHIRIKGTVEEAFSFGDQSMTVFREQAQGQ